MKHVGLFFRVVSLAVLVLVPVVSFAQEYTPVPQQPYTQIKPVPPGQEQRPRLEQRPQDYTLLNDLHVQPKISDYWIGVQCTEILPPLRSHLQLEEKQGMLVEWIMPDSPADKAGVEQYDVFLKVNASPVTSVVDIIKVVEEVKDGVLTVSAIRKGKPIELKITPEKRPQVTPNMPNTPQRSEMPRQHIFRSLQPGVIIEEFGSGDQQEMPEQMRQLLDQIHKQIEEQMGNLPESNGFRFEMAPGINPMLNFGTLGVGANTMQISIEPAHGDQEGSLTVRKNNQTWSVAKFSDLPENVQKEVAEVLENTVNGQDVGDWIAEQMANNRRVTFSVSTSDIAPDNASETPQKEKDIE